MNDCEWCGGSLHTEDAHTVLTNLHMHTRTLPELVDDALADAESYRHQDGRASAGWADVTSVARVMTTPSQRLDGLREEWLTLTDDERDEHAAEFLDDIEDALAATGRYVALSDGGNTGDWLVLDVIAYAYRLLSETITSDERGETVEGSHGIMDADGDYVPMDGIVGDDARRLLDAHTLRADEDDMADVLATYGPADHIDWREDDEAIVYLADLPRVDDDEPYVRAIWVQGPALSDLLEG